MSTTSFIRQRVQEYYRVEDLNCATTTLKILSEIHDIELAPQLLDSALGLHGAGKYGAQCGLVEGSLLFIGIFGRANQIADSRIVELCREFAQLFEDHFGSLLCRQLRPQGFSPNLPPHLCENLTCDAIGISATFMQKLKSVESSRHE